MSFTVAIVGRPNVGKSTLFNRLVGRRQALVHDEPGVTRDRRVGDAELGGLEFQVVDTAGFDEAAADSLAGRMRAQTVAAIEDSDFCLMLVDVRDGITALDHDFAEVLRTSGKPVILVANKCEGKIGADALIDAYELGMGDSVAISAEHGQGLGELLEAIEAHAPQEDEGGGDISEDEGKKGLKIAVIGRPNTGKSTLINQMLGSDRLLTGPEAGITRDAIAIEWDWEGQPVQLFDTAGMRRRARVTEHIERLSVSDALRAVQFAEVVILLIDAERPFEKQDLHIASLVEEEGRALVVAINKWDLVADKQAAIKEATKRLGELLPQVTGVPLVPLSALTGAGVEKLMPAVLGAYDRWTKRLSTSELNRWLKAAVSAHPPPAVRGRRIQLRYATQVKARPPTFVVFSSRADQVPTAYRRYLVNGLRERFGLSGVPIRLLVRKQKNPYAP